MTITNYKAKTGFGAASLLYESNYSSFDSAHYRKAHGCVLFDSLEGRKVILGNTPSEVILSRALHVSGKPKLIDFTAKLHTKVSRLVPHIQYNGHSRPPLPLLSPPIDASMLQQYCCGEHYAPRDFNYHWCKVKIVVEDSGEVCLT